MRIVGILGGMGPAAGADFARAFVAACTAHLERSGLAVTDQAFPEHWLAQVPVPDRLGAGNAGNAGEQGEQGEDPPLLAMQQAIGKLATVGATTVAIACNTAHIWHEQLQRSHPQLEILHVARVVASELAAQGVREIGLLATEMTYQSGLYSDALNAVGIACCEPTPDERTQLMHGIFAGVKRGDLALAEAVFSQVASNLAKRHSLHALVLGCTEIPLALKALPSPFPGSRAPQLIDAAALLAQALAQRAYA